MPTPPDNGEPVESLQDSLSEREIAFYGAMIVGQARLYDVMLMLYAKMDPEGAIKLRALHEQGHLFAPPPAFREGDDE